MRAQSESLPLAHAFLRFGTVLNIIFGVGILALLIISFTVPNWAAMLGVKPGVGVDELKTGMRLIALLGLVAVPINHVFLSRLLEIVNTVREGDPFVMANAVRLRAIAWAAVGLQLVHLAVGLVAKIFDATAQQLDLNWEFDVTPWLAVLLLFVLASVFEHGARMRADLEGTV
jgi:hypothetical protein